MSDSKPTTNWEDQMKEDMELSKSFMSTPVRHVVAGSGLALLLYAFSQHSDMPNHASKLLKVSHLGAFATLFGTQIWVSTVGGLVMFRSMPRHIFGHVQSRMFPAYYNLTTGASAVSLATYVLVHPRGTWCCSGRAKVIALGMAVATSLLSSYLVTPLSISSMWDMYKVERELGTTGMQIGMNYPDKKEHPEFAKLHKNFMIWHGISNVVNLAGVIGAGAYLYYFAKNARI